MANKTKAPSKVQEVVTIRELRMGLLSVPVVSRTSMIQHAFSAKAEKQMEDVQTAKDKTSTPGKKNRPAKDVIEEFTGAIHLLEEKDRSKLYDRLAKLNRGKGPTDMQDVTACFKGIRVGFPAHGVKESCRRGVKGSGMPMTDFSASLWIFGTDGTDLVEIKFKKCLFRRDHVRIGGQFKTTDLRYRPEFFDWSMVIEIEYDEGSITPQDIFNSISRAGVKCGIGEWRPNAPSKPGNHGCFAVDRKALAKVSGNGKKVA